MELGSDRRLLCRAQSRAAHLRQRALLVAAGRVRLPEALQPHQCVAGRRGDARQRRDAARRGRGPDRARTRRRAQVPMKPEDLVRPEVLALKAYPVPSSEGMVKLDAMENPYPLPDSLRRELADALARAELNRYPTPSPQKLRDALARRMGVPAGMEILLGNGSDELIQILITALARPGAAMIYPWPTFVMYSMGATFSGMKAIAVPLRDDFSLDADSFIARMSAEKPALVFLAYPNNPTGVLYPQADVEKILRA